MKSIPQEMVFSGIPQNIYGQWNPAHDNFNFFFIFFYVSELAPGHCSAVLN